MRECRVMRYRREMRDVSEKRKRTGEEREKR
jgi:hypothetical protein